MRPRQAHCNMGRKCCWPAPHNLPDRGREAVFADPQGAVFAVLASSSGDPPDVLAEPGEWIWSSLVTSDPDTDAAFYQTLFDYEVFELPAAPGHQHLMLATDNYARASANTLPVNKPGSHPHWLNYVRVDDTVKMIEKVVALGGRVLVEPRVDRHGGKIAVVADPSGAPFGLIEWPDTESKRGEPVNILLLSRRVVLACAIGLFAILASGCVGTGCRIPGYDNGGRRRRGLLRALRRVLRRPGFRLPCGAGPWL